MTFEELVKENRRQILEDAELMDKIEENLEKKAEQMSQQAK